MIFYENLEHYGIKIANFINFCETMDSIHSTQRH